MAKKQRAIIRPKHGPEWYIQNKVRDFLTDRGWHVERFIGNALQFGIPDLLAIHPRLGHRWIDIKQPKKFSLTEQQRKKWPVWEHFGEGIWIMTAADQDEYDKLMRKPNWRDYWKPSYGNIPDVESMIYELEQEYLCCLK